MEGIKIKRTGTMNEITEKRSKKDILEENYNKSPYHSFPFPNSHPTHLCTIGRLFGLRAPEVETAKILELGCAGGGNLIPIAHLFPQSHCVGIDLANKQIDSGQKLIATLGLQNIELRHQSILDFDSKEGKFDYIL